MPIVGIDHSMAGLILGGAGFVMGALSLVLFWRWSRTTAEHLQATATDLIVEARELRAQARHLMEGGGPEPTVQASVPWSRAQRPATPTQPPARRWPFNG